MDNSPGPPEMYWMTQQTPDELAVADWAETFRKKQHALGLIAPLKFIGPVGGSYDTEGADALSEGWLAVFEDPGSLEAAGQKIDSIRTESLARLKQTYDVLGMPLQGGGPAATAQEPGTHEEGARAPQRAARQHTHTEGGATTHQQLRHRPSR